MSKGLGHRTSWHLPWFLHWVRKHGFACFAVYRIIMGIVVLALAAGMLAR